MSQSQQSPNQQNIVCMLMIPPPMGPKGLRVGFLVGHPNDATYSL